MHLIPRHPLALAVAASLFVALATRSSAAPTPFQPPPPFEMPDLTTTPSPIKAPRNPAATPTGYFMPSESSLAKPPEMKTFAQIIAFLKRCYEDLEKQQDSVLSGRVAEAAAGIDKARKRLKAFDLKLQAKPEEILAGSNTHWKWTVAKEQATGERDAARLKFVIDPPLEGAAAVALSCKKGRVSIDSVRVISVMSGNAVETRFSVKKKLSAGSVEHEVLYLHYPSPVSEIVVDCSRPSSARIVAWAGTTDLPEYAKEAIYWLRLANAELKKGKSQKAPGYIKQAIVKLHLYRRSRNRQ